MRGVTYAYLGPEAEAAKYGKKGTATDVTLLNAKKSTDHLNIVVPTRYPEKITSLCVALDLADEIVLHVNAVDRTLGETIVGAELFQRTRGFIRLGPGVDAGGIQTLLAKTSLKSLEVSTEPEAVFRERLYERVDSSSEGSLVLPVDHAFPVKGVGTVVLGLVRQGVVSTHQNLQAFPSMKTLEVRTIQVHDVDQKSAPTRSRVGLAIKGAEADDLPRGTVLAPPGSLSVLPAGEPTTVQVGYHPFNKWQPKPGAVLHFFHALQDAVVRVESVSGGGLTLKPDAPVVRVPNQPTVLLDLDNKQQRFVGRVTWPG